MIRRSFCVSLQSVAIVRRSFLCLRFLLTGKVQLAGQRRKVKTVDLLETAGTPMFGQFKAIKDQYKGYLLLFQVGEFYEFYGDDAVTVSNRTSLRMTQKQGVPMAGFPVWSLDEWLKTLLNEGFKLAICDQSAAR